jgi:F0F1-type ATP synthase assembly protein I
MQDRQRLIRALRFVGLGWTIVGCLAVGLGLGLWLDSVLSLRPLFTIIGIFVGAISGLWTMIRMIRDLNR